MWSSTQKAYDQSAHQILEVETEKHLNLTSSIGAELTIIGTETLRWSFSLAG